MDCFGPVVESAGSALRMLAKVPRIHNDFPSTSKEDYVEKLRIKASGENFLVLDYASDNGLIVFFEELAQALVEHYGDPAQIQVREVGANHWELEVRAQPAGA